MSANSKMNRQRLLQFSIYGHIDRNHIATSVARGKSRTYKIKAYNKKNKHQYQKEIAFPYPLKSTNPGRIFSKNLCRIADREPNNSKYVYSST